LEFYTGDAFLKYLSSIYVFVTNPAQKEGTLHIHRQRIISNRSLLENASRSGLPQYIQAKPFSFRLWQPPNFDVFSNVHDSFEHRAQVENEESTGDAAIPPADVPESERKPQSFHNPESSPDETNKVEPALSGMSPGPEKNEVTTERAKPKRKSKKKKQLEDQDSQWLGDKVRLTIVDQSIH